MFFLSLGEIIGRWGHAQAVDTLGQLFHLTSNFEGNRGQGLGPHAPLVVRGAETARCHILTMISSFEKALPARRKAVKHIIANSTRLCLPHDSPNRVRNGINLIVDLCNRRVAANRADQTLDGLDKNRSLVLDVESQIIRSVVLLRRTPVGHTIGPVETTIA